MMSNGPRSASLVGPERLPLDLDGLTDLLGSRRTQTYRKPSRSSLERAPQLLSAAAGPRAARSRGRARLRFRSWHTTLGQVEHDRDRQHVMLPRSATSGLRASALHVGGVDDVSRPAASRLAATKCSTSKASSVAAWSFSSSQTRARQKSEDSTSVGLKCLRANVTCPTRWGRPATTRLGSEIVDRHRVNTPICVGGPTPGPPGRPAGSGPRSRTGPPRPSAQCPELARASTRSGGRGGGACRRAASRSGRCTRRSAS